jgi:hypothetical protein
MLDTQFNKKTFPTRAEIRTFCKQRLIGDKLSECISNLQQSILRDSEIWLEGYVVGVRSDNFQEPIDDNIVKDFYLDILYTHYIKPKLIE